ncbi:GGDEF domain-containing protein [Paraburkholderia nodosa]|uniref:GGDEF domain-containing protein n=1 Tax=Paraburkholderia nodosa TaxID=392320 RepID=UPI0009DE2D88|nr:GGDEF domain-containing protein [Paraburkholderia nodosa]
MVVVAGMPYTGRTRFLEKRRSFRDATELRLFLESAAQSSRHLAVAVQLFGLVSWLMSRAFANPHAHFDVRGTLVAASGMLLAMGVTYASRGLRMDALGRFACAAFVALAFHFNMPGTSSPAFWVLPIGVAINVGMAPVISGYFNYLASALTVWLIISHGEVVALMSSQDRNWILLFALAALALGLLLNLLFTQERKKTFLVQRELARLAFRDTLTGIANRRSFMLEVNECQDRRSSEEFWLLLIDVDDFKQINDTAGHDAGDEVLAAVARAIEEGASPHFCGRLGGEEFGVIFSGNQQSADYLAHEICGTVAAARISGHRVTVSIGVSSISELIGVPETFRLADRALYEAKRRGKNRSVLAEPESW